MRLFLQFTLLCVQLLCLSTLPASAFAQGWTTGTASFEDEPAFLPVTEAYDPVVTLNKGTLNINWQIADNYYLYKEKFSTRTLRAEQLTERPQHPYTQALLAQIPRFDVRSTRYDAIKGEIPSPLNPPAGCHFHPRCPHAMARCREEVPVLREVSPNHLSACHLNEQ